MRPQPAARTAGLDNPLLRTFQSVLGRPGIMSFGAGFMNPAGFDVAGVRAAFAAALADEQAPATLQYGLAEGSERLRAAIVGRMAGIGVPAVASEIVVTTGATQALDLLCNALLDPGDIVLVERPTYVMPLQRLALAQARVVSVAGDEDGARPGRAREGGGRARPEGHLHHSGLPEPRRDDAARRPACGGGGDRRAARRLGDRGRPLPRTSLRSRAAGADRQPLAGAGTLHRHARKTVAPGLRVGWVVAPAEVVDLCRPVKQAMDFNTSTVDQAAAAIYLENVNWERRTAELRAVYAAPMRAMIDRIGDVLPEGSTFTRPQGGVFVWGELPEGWSAEALLERAVELGIFFMPGAVFFPDVRSETTLRLSISNHTPESVAEGLERLRAAVAAPRQPAGAAG